MKYNPAVRKNILLQEMTAYTTQEDTAFADALATIDQLDDNTNDELGQAFVTLMRSLVHDNIARANKVRNALNVFFDETGEFDEDTYLLFKPYEVVEHKEVEPVPDEEVSVESEDTPTASVVETAEPESDEEAPVEVSEEDAEVYESLPDDVQDESEDVNVISDVFGTTEEELKTRDKAEALSSVIDLPDANAL